MSKQNIGTEIGKGRIHDGRYLITQSGHIVTIEVWAHDGHAVETYRIKGVVRDHFADGQIGNILKDTVNRMQRMNAMMRRFGVDRMAPVGAKNPVCGSDRRSVRSANDFLSKYKV
jgi:hypothetical protein